MADPSRAVDTPTPPDRDPNGWHARTCLWAAGQSAVKDVDVCGECRRLAALATPDPSIPERPNPRLTGKLRRRFEDVLARLDEPKMGNPKYGMDRRAIEGELRAVTRDALDLADAAVSAALGSIPERPAEPLDRTDFDRIAAEAAERVKGENADRYVDLRIAVELADTRTGVVEEKDGMVEVYSLRASDWNRVVAVARGHMSQKTRRSLDRFLDRVTAQSMKGSAQQSTPESEMNEPRSEGILLASRLYGRLPGTEWSNIIAAIEDSAILRAEPSRSSPDPDLTATFRAELDRTEAVRGALHPVVCEIDHDHATAPEHWRCVVAADTAIEAFGSSTDIDPERLARAICGSRMPFVEEEDDLYVDDKCRAWASAAAAEYSRLGSSPDLTGPAREADPQ